MKKFIAIWYTLDKEIKRDNISADDEESAKKAAYLKYGGTENAPAPLLSIIGINEG